MFGIQQLVIGKLIVTPGRLTKIRQLALFFIKRSNQFIHIIQSIDPSGDPAQVCGNRIR